MKRTKLLLIAMSVWAYGYAQETHVIEPAILEVRYDSWQEEYDDSYILRVGKTANQFFSYYRYRDDSLMTSTIGNEWLYQDMTTGKLALYSFYASAYNTYEEDIPKQEWTIHADSVMTILGMECHKATTKFRGRVWEVWFTEEIPISLGPWKLGGLPGLILKATADHDFIKFTAISIKNESINPVTFYNWGDEKFYHMTREKFLKYKNRPRTIPYTEKVVQAKPYIWMLSLRGFAQETHVIEPSILEVRYEVTHEKDKDMFALRCGKNVSQYYSVGKLRDDSLRASPDPTVSQIPLDEMMEEAMHRDDPSKRRPSSPCHSDYLYWNLSVGKVSVYTSVFGSKYVIEEETPTMDWDIFEDSVQTIIGYECHKAVTKFRGREWAVWYADGIPVSLGPWKLNGLPGIILQAECDGYMKMNACGIMTSDLSPVTFYNFAEYKFQPVERKKLLKMKMNPNSYPANTKITPTMELE